MVETKELGTLFLHTSVDRTSTRLEDVIERKQIATLLRHSSVVRTSTRVEGAVERMDLPSLLPQSSVVSRKTLEQRFIFQIGTLNPHGINERFSFN